MKISQEELKPTEALKNQISELGDSVGSLMKDKPLIVALTVIGSVFADLVTEGIEAGIDDFLDWNLMVLRTAVKRRLDNKDGMVQ